MSFLNAALAAGVAAFVVPLLIHLLYRNRVRPVRWGAMHLLSEVVVTNRRRMRVTNWILLAIRCLIPVLLAIALARPLIEGLSSNEAGARRGIVLVMDDSASMAAVDERSQSRWQLAKQTAIEILSTARRNDPLMVVSGSGIGPSAGVGGVADARRSLENLQAVGPAVSLASMVRLGIDAASMLDLASASIVIVTDAAENVIDQTADEQVSAIAATLADRAELQVSVFGVGELDGSSPRNISIGEIDLGTPISLAGQPTAWSATIDNQTDVPVSDATLTISDNRGLMEKKTISIDPRSSRRVSWQTPAADVGSATLSLSIDVADDFAIDNTRTIGFMTMAPMPAIVVDDSPQRGITERAGGYLALALTPFRVTPSSTGRRDAGDRNDAGDQLDAIESSIVSSSEVERYLRDVDRRRATIFFTDNVQWRAQWVDPLNDYVRSGGQCVVLAGDDLDIEFFQTHGNKLGMPARWTELIQLPEDSIRETSFIATTPWARLGFDRGVSMNISTMRGMTPIALDLDQEIVSSPEVWWRTKSASPLAMARNWGSGRWVQIAIPANQTWSHWPLRAAMLPMLQSLVLDHGLTRSVRQTTIGDTVTMRVPLGRRQSGSNFEWIRADGKSYPAAVNQVGMASTKADLPGVLRLAARQNSSEPDAASEGGSEMFTIVGLDPAESNLRGADAAAIGAAAKRLGANYYHDPADYGSGEILLRDGREIWRPLIWALLALLVGELVWQQRGRRGGTASTSRDTSVSSIRPARSTS